MSQQAIPSSKANELRYDYLIARMRTKDILKKYNCTWSTLYKTLMRYGIEKRGLSQTTCNHSFFSQWSPEMAWVLGLWITDGSISHIGQSFSARIGFANFPLTKRVHDLLETSRKISYSPRKNFWYFGVNSQSIYNDLSLLGVLEQKAKRTVLPECPNTYLHHLIRGIFDGDGCVYIVKRPSHNPKCRVNFVSASENFILAISRILTSVTNVSPIPRRVSHCQCWRIVYSHRAACKLALWMYDNSKGLRNETKYQKFAPFI